MTSYPERFSNLPEYAFPRLRTLLDVHAPGGDVIHMTIGDPKHDFPAWVTDEIVAHADGFRNYPTNEGAPELLGAMANWVKFRFDVDIDPATQLLALNGTREGLYNAAMALGPETKNGQSPIVLIPNPFYQAYAVAALSVGATPMYLPATQDNNFLPDFAGLSPDILNRVTIAYLCSPSNPQGAVASRDYWETLIGLAEQYDFKVFADECYSEIYREEGKPPVGALTVARDMGADPERIVVFHSLSKRSNLAGLRSGFAASGPENIRRMRLQRSYSGTPVPQPLQMASARVWSDEDHVIASRALYQAKFRAADEILGNVPGYFPTQAGFFLWLPVEDGEEAAVKLWTKTGVRVLPGSYLAREADGFNPGAQYIRAAMVAPIEEMKRGLIQLRDCLYG